LCSKAPIPADLEKWTATLADRLQEEPQLADVATDLAQQGLAAYLTIDRDSAARFGITAATIDNALYDAFGQRIISTIFTQSNQYRVIMEANPALQRSPDSLYRIYVPASGGGQVPLSAIARVDVRNAPLVINHLSQFPANTISFNVPRGGSLGAAVEAIRRAERAVGMPASVLTSFQGAALAFEASLANELFLILAAILTMYIILGVLYESFIHPITILSTLPSAGVGALLALMVVGSDLGVIGIIGIILLIGIVKKNAIMMIDFALDAERKPGAVAARCDLPGLPVALSPDPDDHDGGAAGRGAADARHGHRVGAAAPARHHHRRRADRQPGADPVHDARDLPDVRRLGGADARGPAGRGGKEGRVPREYFTSLRAAARRDHPDLDRHRARGDGGLFPPARRAPAAGGHSDHHRVGGHGRRGSGDDGEQRRDAARSATSGRLRT